MRTPCAQGQGQEQEGHCIALCKTRLLLFVSVVHDHAMRCCWRAASVGFACSPADEAFSGFCARLFYSLAFFPPFRACISRLAHFQYFRRPRAIRSASRIVCMYIYTYKRRPRNYDGWNTRVRWNTIPCIWPFFFGAVSALEASTSYLYGMVFNVAYYMYMYSWAGPPRRVYDVRRIRAQTAFWEERAENKEIGRNVPMAGPLGLNVYLLGFFSFFLSFSLSLILPVLFFFFFSVSACLFPLSRRASLKKRRCLYWTTCVFWAFPEYLPALSPLPSLVSTAWAMCAPATFFCFAAGVLLV